MSNEYPIFIPKSTSSLSTAQIEAQIATIQSEQIYLGGQITTLTSSIAAVSTAELTDAANIITLQAQRVTDAMNIATVTLAEATDASNIIILQNEEMNLAAALTFSGANTNALGNVTVKSGNSITLNESSNAAGITLMAPTSGVTSYTMTLPSSQGGSGQVLENDGSGHLLWATISTGGGGNVVNGLNTGALTLESDTSLSIGTTNASSIDFVTNSLNQMSLSSTGTLAVAGPIVVAYTDATPQTRDIVASFDTNSTATGTSYSQINITKSTYGGYIAGYLDQSVSEGISLGAANAGTEFMNLNTFVIAAAKPITSTGTVTATNITSTNSTDIAANASAITTLQTRVTTDESNITANTTAITALQTRATTDESNITANTTAITALQTRATTDETLITTNTTGIASIISNPTFTGPLSVSVTPATPLVREVVGTFSSNPTATGTSYTQIDLSKGTYGGYIAGYLIQGLGEGLSLGAFNTGVEYVNLSNLGASFNYPITSTGTINSTNVYTDSNNNNSLGGNFPGTLTGSSNMNIGNGSRSLTSGQHNVSVGDSCLYSATTGSENIAIGDHCLLNSNGSHNIAMGVTAALGASTANDCVSIGFQSSYNNNTGNYNTALGTGSLFDNNGGSYNVALGMNAGYFTSASNNTFIGYNANPSNSGYTNCVAIGANATVNASNVIQLGNSSITQVNTSGALNAANLYTNSTNNAFGYDAGFGTTTASSLTAMGDRAGYTSNGAGNTFLGASADTSSSTITNCMALGAGAVVNSSNCIQLGNTSVSNVFTSGILTAGNITATNYTDITTNTSNIAAIMALLATCYASWTSSQTIAYGSVVALANAASSLGGSAFSVSGTTLLCNVTGVYSFQINSTCALATNPTFVPSKVMVQINNTTQGTNTLPGQVIMGTNFGTVQFSAFMNGYLQCNSGDTINIYFIQSTGVNMTVSAVSMVASRVA
jgi:hypothetical protein